MAAAIPKGIQHPGLEALPRALSEAEVLTRLRDLADRNRPGIAMIGLGYHPTITPAVIRRNVLEDPSWYTAYTPYQPEISQGRLEALINFQTMVADLTGLATANASLLDEGTAAGEALTLIRRATRGKDDLPIVVDAGLLPQTRAVVETRAEALGIELVEADLAERTTRASRRPAWSSPTRAPTAGSSIRRRPSRLRTPRADSRSSSPTRSPWSCSRRPARSAPTSSWARRSASASRCSTAVRTPPSWPCATGWSDSCPDDSWVSRSMRQVAPPTGWPCRPVSSTFAVRRPRRTSAPPRSCWPSRRRCTPSTTVPTACAASPSTSTTEHDSLAAGLRAGGVELVAEEFFDTVVAQVPGRAADVVKSAHADGIHLRLVDDHHVGITTSEITTTNHVARVLTAFSIEAVPAIGSWSGGNRVRFPTRSCGRTRS